MKKTFISPLSLLVVFSIFSSQVRADDSFFKGDDKHFVAVVFMTVSGSNYVKLSGCEVQGDLKSALCTDLALIESGNFSDMRGCETTKMYKNGAIAVAGGGLAAGLLIMSAGTMSELAWLAVMGGSFGAFSGYVGARDNYKIAGIFSEENQVDRDYVTGRMKYAQFISLLRGLLAKPSTEGDCNVAGHTRAVATGSYMTSLTADQLKMLSGVAK